MRTMAPQITSLTIVYLAHWDRVTHICVSNWTIIGSDNGLSPGRRQSIIWTNAWILLIRASGTNFDEIWSEIHTFSFKKMHLKMSSGKWRPFCIELNVLTVYSVTYQRKHQSSPSLAFVRGIHWRPVNSPHIRPVTRKMFPFDDVIMITSAWHVSLKQNKWSLRYDNYRKWEIEKERLKTFG